MIRKTLSLFLILLAVGAEFGSAQTAAKRYYLVDGLFPPHRRRNGNGETAVYAGFVEEAGGGMSHRQSKTF